MKSCALLVARIALAALDVLAGLACLAVAACSSQSGAAKPARLECASIPGVEAVADSRAIIVFGEMHGTNESPRIFGEVVCHVAKRQRRAVVALEISHTEQASIDTFIAGGGETSRAAMLASPHWTRAYQDGRSSVAMLALFDRLRALHEEGLGIEVVAFDPLPEQKEERETNLAKRIAAARTAHPDRPILVLTGNLHPWTREGAPWDDKFVPMGRHLVQQGIDVLPIELRFGPGRAWMCGGATPDTCGEADIPGGARAGVVGLELFSRPDDRGYRGSLFVGPITASPPALAVQSSR